MDKLRQDITFEATLHGQALKFATTWGLFSPRAIAPYTDPVWPWPVLIFDDTTTLPPG